MSCRRWTVAALLSLAMLPRVPAHGEPQAASEPRVEKSPAAVDAFGDALPRGAIVRLGTLRWRHGGLIAASTFAPDGNVLATGAQDGSVWLWDCATGKKLRQFKGLQ